MANVNKWMIDPRDAVLLLIDHQSGLFQLVKDIEPPVLRSNVTALAKMAHLAKIPTITTASVPDGPNGPLIPEIHQCNPEAVYVPRTGQINAWDNPAWVKAIEQTTRKTLLIAGTLTSICMALPALSAVTAGYKVFCIIDASGNWSKWRQTSRWHALSRPAPCRSTLLPSCPKSWKPGTARTRGISRRS